MGHGTSPHIGVVLLDVIYTILTDTVRVTKEMLCTKYSMQGKM